jgi:hypothetical protein
LPNRSRWTRNSANSPSTSPTSTRSAPTPVFKT